MNSLCHKYLNQNILPFVGREQELRRLRGLFREFLEEGESKYSLITGESGSGKSRLVREFEDYLSEEFGDTCIIVHARYLEGNAAAMTPIINAFAAALAQHEHIKNLLQSLKLLQRDHVRLALNNRSHSFEAEPPPLQTLLDSLSEIARRFPLVVILEDIHNVEDLPVFDQFFLSLSSAAKFVILTERTGVTRHFSSRNSEQFIREIALREERVSEVIQLADFEPQEVKKLFQLLFTLLPSANLLQSIHESTGGRPLLLRTMLRHCVATGAVQYANGEWFENQEAVIVHDADAEGEQETFARFQQELERLNTYEQIVLFNAALLGEQFDLRLLRKLVSYTMREHDLTEELFTRVIDLLTFKSIIRRATPSIYLYPERDLDPKLRSELNVWCYEFSHQHFWNTVIENARRDVAGKHEVLLGLVSIAYTEHLPLYSSTFLAITGLPFTVAKTKESLMQVESFLRWSAAVVHSLWSIEPQQSLRFLLSVRPLRDELTWRFGPDLSEGGMSALLDLHSLLVEAFLRTGSLLEAERDLEHAAVLDKFVQSTKAYSLALQGIARGKVAALRAILFSNRTLYAEFEQWSVVASEALSVVPADDLERARLLTMLTRTKAEALLNTGKFTEADALIDHDMPTARLLADTRFDEYSLYYRVAVTSKLKQDQNEQARDLTEQIIQLAKQRENTLVETTFLFQATLASFSTGRLLEAVQYCELGIQNGRRYGIRFVEIMSTLWRMIIAGVEQDGEQVKECSQQLALLAQDARIVAQTPNLLQRISLIEGHATAMNFLGRPHAALEFAEEAIQLAGNHHHDSFAAWAQNEKALALNSLRRFDEAAAVARSCISLAGEQRMAERTARTALFIAYTGLGKLELAWQEVELLRGSYHEVNPYYLRFALAEARLLRASLSHPDYQRERSSMRARLIAKVNELLKVCEGWQTRLLAEQIAKEFENVMPKKQTPEWIGELVAAGEPEEAEEPPAILRLHTFGQLHAESIDASGRTLTDTAPESRGRDTKVRQLISMLVAARAEATDGKRSKRHIGGLSRESLVDVLWPDSDETSGTNALYTTIKRARAFLGNSEAIVLAEGTYALGSGVVTDCEEILRHYAEARQSRRRNALFSITFHYEEILKASARGPFFDGIYGGWLDGLRTRMATLHRTAAIRLIETNLERGMLDRVEDLCHGLLLADEFDEEALQNLMVVTARRRQSARLFSLYESYVRKLKQEFRSEPSQELKDLYQSLTLVAAE